MQCMIVCCLSVVSGDVWSQARQVIENSVEEGGGGVFEATLFKGKLNMKLN